MENRQESLARRGLGGLKLSWLTAVFCWVTVMGLSSSPLYAQNVAATIQGTITDGTGAVIPAATVTVINLETNIQRRVTSNAVGFYAVTNLPPGRYRVEMAVAGFQTRINENVILAVGQRSTLNTTLQLGDVTEQVTVTAEELALPTTTSEVGGIISPQEVQELPLLSRDFRDLTSLMPGVIPIPASYTSGAVVGTTSRSLRTSISGGRLSATAYYLDGLYINQKDGMAPQGVTGSQLGIDVIREFRVLVNSYTSEYGRNGGGVINMVSRSGTNGFHGSVYEFFRNDKLDARNFFAIPDKSSLRRNQFGFTVGGPILRDKTFFFLSWEALRAREGIPLITNVPDLPARSGLFPDASGNLVAVPNVIGNRAAQAVMNLYPLPNTNVSCGVGCLESNVPFSAQTREDMANLRIDQALTKDHNFFARYTFNHGKRVVPGRQPTFFQRPRIRNQWITAQEDWVVTPQVVNTARFGFSRIGEGVNEFPSEGTVIDPIAIIPTRFDVGEFVIGDYSATGQRSATVGEQESFETYQFSNDMVIASAKHTVKIGARVERLISADEGDRMNSDLDASTPGLWTWLTPRDFFGGRVLTLRDSVGLTSEGVARVIKQTLLGAYVHDEFRILDNLTLNIGLRVEHLTPPVRTPDLFEMSNFYSDSIQQRKPFGYQTRPVLAPRFGFAWTPVERDATFVVRGGVGLFYDHLTDGFISNTYSLNWPYRTQTILANGNFYPNPYPNGAVDYPPPQASASHVIVDDLSVPTVYQFNFALAKSLFADKVQLTGNYVGSQGRHLTLARVINNPPAQTVNGRVFYDKTLPKANPNWSQDIKLSETTGMSYYHSFQFHAKGNLGGGSSLEASYTYSKCIDTSSQENTGDFGALAEKFVYHPTDIRNNRGLCGMDIRQRLALNGVYGLPFRNLTGLGKILLEGWSLSSIVQVSDGAPFTQRISFPRSTTQIASSNARQERPDLAPGVDLSNKSKYVFPGNPIQYFDPAMFALQPEGFLGNSGRNLLIGPGLVTVDLSISRTIPVRESVDLQFRTEFFNLFNRVNFGLPAFLMFTNTSGRPSGSTGRISNTSTSSRQMQFALKLVF